MLKRKLSTFLPVLLMVIFLAIFFSSSPFLVNSHSLLNAEAFSGYSQYTVKSGDSLFIIARQYGISVEDLKRANALASDILMPGQILKVPGQQFPWKEDKPLWQVLMEKGITNPGPGLKLVVDKSDHTLSLFYGDTWLKSYHTEFGEGGMEDKEVAGDRLTPEGTFYITEMSTLNPPDYYLGSRWLMLSYPDSEDADRGLWQGLIDQWTHDEIVAAFSDGRTPPQYTDLGGRIGIHGGDKPEFDNNWTWGCIGLTNSDIEDFYDYVSIGTPVIIVK